MFVLMRKPLVFTVVTAVGIGIGSLGGPHGLQRSPSSQHPALPLTADLSSAEPPLIATAGERLILWTMFVLLAPITTSPLAGRLLAQQSNAANVLLLFGYTALDGIVAWILGSVNVGGSLSAIGYLTGLLVVFSYNLWICAFLARLQQE